MKLVLRNLLFFFCLIILSGFSSYAAENSAENPEILQARFIQIEISNANAYSISVLKAFQTLSEFIQSRYYSLLNWKLYSRGSKLEIENYDRNGQFGRWVNDPNDETCYNTRAKVLLRDSTKPVAFKETNRCLVEQGSWRDPYTGETLREASDIQIDHLVPLKNAYISGAHQWSFRARCLYANYLGYDSHLMSVSGEENMKKSDKSPDKYMPPNQNYSCSYVRQWLTVKLLWGLSMTVAEANAIRKVISENNCSTTQLRITDAELNRQRRFAQANIDLCERMELSQNSGR